MKPPHWLCKHCGIIINDSGGEPSRCSYCDHQGFIHVGYEGEYDPVDVRAEHDIIFDPDKFSTEMKRRYWDELSPEEKASLQARIRLLAEKVRQRRAEEHGDLFGEDE